MNRLLLLIPLLAGCAATGSERLSHPSVRPATIHAARTKSRSVRVAQVDGKVVGDSYRGYPDVVEVPSGERRIKLHITARRGGAAFRELGLAAREGANYAIRFDPSADSASELSVWIEDMASAVIVAGERPAAPAESNAPLMESTVARDAWVGLAPETRLKVVLASGQSLNARFIAFDGAYLWVTLASEDRKAWHKSEIEKISALVPAR